VPVYIIELIFKIALAFLPNNSTVDLVHQLWIMLSATLVILYSMYDLYAFTYTRKHFFLYTTKYKIPTMLLIYAAIYIVANIIFYTLYSLSDVTQIMEFNTTQFLHKSLSLTAFYLVNVFMLLTTKALWTKKLGQCIYGLVIILLMVAVPIVYIVFTKDIFGVGVGLTSEVSRQIYTFILPVYVFEEDAQNLAIDPTFYPMVFNACLATFSFVLWFFVSKVKQNW